MVIHACFLAVLIGTSVGGADEGPRLASHIALADVERVCLVVRMQGLPPDEPLIDAAGLKNRVVTQVTERGIGCVERGTLFVPRLLVLVETLGVPETGRYVYRVQTSLDRPVMVPGRPETTVPAQVWQSGPVMQLAARANASEAVTLAALAQVEAFADACGAARLQGQALPPRREETSSSAQTAPQNLQQAAGPAFVASRTSAVFHRADCRWAQNIAENNRIGYETREQAIQAGKRPCRTCKP